MFPDIDSNSGKLYRRACKVMPGGNTRTSLFWPPHHIYAAAADGSRVRDVDGVERIDLNYNFTTLIHGHGHPVVVERLREQIGHMISIGMATELEIKLAELLVSRIRSVESIRFTNSGTEAVLAAIKAARAFTLRPKIAKCEGVYHGSSDIMEISNASPPDCWGEVSAPAPIPMSSGTPRGVTNDILVLPYNRPEESLALLDRHAGDVAAVIIDPLPVRAGLVPATKEYLHTLREFTRQNGSLLVFDEVLTFRLGYHGAQEVFGFEPDLTTLGKIIGGGLPVGAVGGRADVMSVFDPRNGFRVWHGGTFNGNPSTMCAGLAAMEFLTENAIERLNHLGDIARAKALQAFEQAGVPGQVTGMGSLLRLHCTSRKIHDYRSFYPTPAEARMLDRLMLYVLNNGFLITRMGTAALSTVTTEEELERFRRVLQAGLEILVRERETVI